MAQATTDPITTMQKARLAIQEFACVPQAQRRYIQMGWMQNDAIVNLDNAVEDLDNLVSEDLLTAEQAGKMRELHRLLHQGIETHEDFFEEKSSESREFLLGHALENDEWETIRQFARGLFDDVAGEGSVFIAINAK